MDAQKLRIANEKKQIDAKIPSTFPRVSLIFVCIQCLPAFPQCNVDPLFSKTVFREAFLCTTKITTIKSLLLHMKLVIFLLRVSDSQINKRKND